MKTYEATSSQDFDKIGNFVKKQQNELSSRCWMLATAGKDLQTVKSSGRGQGFIASTEDDEGNLKAVVGLTVRDVAPPMPSPLKEGDRVATSFFAMLDDSDMKNYNAEALTDLIRYVLAENIKRGLNVKVAEIIVTNHILEVLIKALENNNLKLEVKGSSKILGLALYHLTAWL